MLKAVLLSGAMAIAAPAIAQDIQTVPAQGPTSQADPTSQPMQNVAPAQPSDPATVTGPVEPAQTAQAASADSAAATPAQIAQIVDQEFPKYDRDSTGELDEGQFGEWMLALRSASEPGLTAENPELKSWVTNAFASADTDQSKAVSKAELTDFLSQGA